MGHVDWLAAGGNSAGSISKMRNSMKILLNADDLGYHADVNTGVLHAHQNGIIRSTSLMIRGEAVLDVVQLAKDAPNLEIGLHFNVTSGQCCAEPNKIPLLADETGTFRFDSTNMPAFIARLRTLVSSEKQFLDQIEREFWAQVEQFHHLGLTPRHLDIHHYINLVHINLFSQYVGFANQLAIPFRGLCYPILQMMRIPAGIEAEMQGLVRESRVPAPEVSISNLLGSRLSKIPDSPEYERMVEIELEKLANSGVKSVEFVTHPAHISPAFRDKDDYVWARELETALVNSISFAGYLERNNHCIITHAELR